MDKNIDYYKQNPDEFAKDFFGETMLDDPFEIDERLCSKERREAIMKWFREPLIKPTRQVRIVSFRIPEHEYGGWEKNFFGIIADLHDEYWSTKYKSENSKK